MQQVPAGTGMMIIVDGVYSMEGDIADVPSLLKVAQKYGSALALDDAHAVGVLGPRGDGTAAHFGLVDEVRGGAVSARDPNSTRLNSSHLVISYAVFCLKKKKTRDFIETASAP